MAGTNKLDMDWCLRYTTDEILKQLRLLNESLETSTQEETERQLSYFFEVALPVQFQVMIDYFLPAKSKEFKELLLTAKASRHMKRMQEMAELKAFLEVR